MVTSTFGNECFKYRGKINLIGEPFDHNTRSFNETRQQNKKQIINYKHMKTLIGLDQTKSEKLAKKLNLLLADYQIYYQNLRGFHWNIKGEKFFELHLKFEELYTDAQLKIDEIAERVLTLGHTPLHTFSDYTKTAAVKEAKGIADANKSMQTVVNNLAILLELEREILTLSGDANDEGTNALMSDYITQQEKTVWMLTAWLGKK